MVVCLPCVPQQALCEVLQDNGGEQDAEQARITKTIHARVDAAEDTIKELNERLEKMRAHAGMLEADLEKVGDALQLFRLPTCFIRPITQHTMRCCCAPA